MQAKNLELFSAKVGCFPIIDKFVDRLGLQGKLSAAVKSDSYAEALIALAKNVLVAREALYAVQSWAQGCEGALGSARLTDDRLGRALDKLFAADRATLQTRIVVDMIKAFDIRMDRVHGDTTSVSVHGEYAGQDPKAVQLKRGHSKDHRPDLKQLVYSLCVSSDGAVPVHFKCCDGNRSDASLQMDTWSALRSLLRTPDFTYVADSKLCVEETMRKIDAEHGRFVTVVPRTRTETKEFSQALDDGDVRWEKIWTRGSSRKREEIDVFEQALGSYRLREGFALHWFRSSQKRKRDARARKSQIARATARLESLDLRRLRGPKTEASMRKRIAAVIARYGAQEWLEAEVKIDLHERFRASHRGRATEETTYRRETYRSPRVHVRRKEEAIARAQQMDGIFPLTTNTKEKPVDVLKIYKYQPKLEKRHSLLKTTLQAAPIWLKKNSRIEALMFVDYLAQTIAALIERELRQEMKAANVGSIASLPEGRTSNTPTFEQLLKLFENRDRHELREGKRLVKSFADPLSPVQNQVLGLLKVPAARYLGPV